MRTSLVALALIGCGGGGDALPNPPADLQVTFTEVARIPRSFQGQEYATVSGKTLYFGNHSNGGAEVEQFFMTWSEAEGPVERPVNGNTPLCACGYSGQLLADAQYLYYLAGDAMRMTLDTFMWERIPDELETYVRVGEAAQAFAGTRLHLVGGRGDLLTHQYYDTTTGTFGKAADLPEPMDDACAGTYDGTLYVIGAMKGYRFDSERDAWEQLAETAKGCSRRSGHQWQSRLLFADYGGIHVFDPPSQTFGAALVPPTVTPDGAIGVTDDDQLYYITETSASDPTEIVIYRIAPQ